MEKENISISLHSPNAVHHNGNYSHNDVSILQTSLTNATVTSTPPLVEQHVMDDCNKTPLIPEWKLSQTTRQNILKSGHKHKSAKANPVQDSDKKLTQKGHTAGNAGTSASTLPFTTSLKDININQSILSGHISISNTLDCSDNSPVTPTFDLDLATCHVKNILKTCSVSTSHRPLHHYHHHHAISPITSRNITIEDEFKQSDHVVMATPQDVLKKYASNNRKRIAVENGQDNKDKDKGMDGTVETLDHHALSSNESTPELQSSMLASKGIHIQTSVKSNMNGILHKGNSLLGATKCKTTSTPVTKAGQKSYVNEKIDLYKAHGNKQQEVGDKNGDDDEDEEDIVFNDSVLSRMSVSYTGYESNGDVRGGGFDSDDDALNELDDRMNSSELNIDLKTSKVLQPRRDITSKSGVVKEGWIPLVTEAEYKTLPSFMKLQVLYADILK